MRQPCTTRYDRARRYTTVYGNRIAPYTEHRCFPFNHFVFLYDLRIRNPFLTVSLRIRASYTEAVHDLRISPFFSVNGRLRSCMFDLGMCRITKGVCFESHEVIIFFFILSWYHLTARYTLVKTSDFNIVFLAFISESFLIHRTNDFIE